MVPNNTQGWRIDIDAEMEIISHYYYFKNENNDVKSFKGLHIYFRNYTYLLIDFGWKASTHNRLKNEHDFCMYELFMAVLFGCRKKS